MENPYLRGKFWGFSDPVIPKMVLCQRDPQKALPYAETRILSHHALKSVACSDLWASRRNEKKMKYRNIENKKHLSVSISARLRVFLI